MYSAAHTSIGRRAMISSECSHRAHSTVFFMVSMVTGTIFFPPAGVPEALPLFMALDDRQREEGNYFFGVLSRVAR